MLTIGKKLPRLVVTEKTGFRNNSNEPVIICDERGIPFYDTSQLLKRVQMFNLPAGNYVIKSGKFVKMPQAISYPLAPMPPRERNKGSATNFDVEFVNNPHTGTVSWNDRMKFYDYSLTNVPLPYLCFIDEHENGHQYYVTETYCDRYAANQLLERGYNPSQIAEAIIFTLSADKIERKEETVNALLNANIQPDSFEKDFPNVQWNTEPLLANPLLFWQDWWNAATWMRWHTKVMEKYGRDRANEVFLIWWNRAPLLSPTIDYRTFDKPFIEYAKKNGFYDALFSGVGGAIGKVAGALNKTAESAGDAAEDVGNFFSFIGSNLFLILLIGFLIWLKFGRQHAGT